MTKRKVYVTKPPKPVSEMTDAERRSYAETVVAAMKAKSGGSR